MRIVASACLVLAILFMVGCGTSAEDKKMIQDNGTKLTALEKKVGDIEKTIVEHTTKITTIWDYLVANNVNKVKFPPEPVTTKTTTTTTKTEVKKETPAPVKPTQPAKTTEPGKTK